MRVEVKWGVAGIAAALGASMALAAGGSAAVVRDWGLHREWRVERDAVHPERPGQLVEIPWSTPPRAPGKRNAAKDQGAPAAAQEQPAPVVRPGMRVTVWRRGEEAEIRMTGTALEAGGVGKVIRVRAGLSQATLHGVVRGPSSVELVPGKGWQ
jgi:Chaperone for flagella basal body P-ring formation